MIKTGFLNATFQIESPSCYKEDPDPSQFITYENYSIENVLKTGIPLLACRSEDFNDSDDDVSNLNSGEFLSIAIMIIPLRNTVTQKPLRNTIT